MNEFTIDRTLFPDHRSPGARALVELHENYLRRFHRTWAEARAKDLKLPAVDDPDYASLDSLLVHVLTAAAAYMQWICRSLKLPDPGFEPAPQPGEGTVLREGFPGDAESHLEHVLDRWRSPLVGLDEEQLYRPGYPTRRGVDAGIESMLQHAIVHPIRHDYQLRKLLDAGKSHPKG